MSFKAILKEVLPPVVVKVLTTSKSEGWFGNYPNWQAAQEQSNGYDSDVILNKVKESLLKVKNGEAVYERDSVIFDEIEYSWQMLACIMWVAAKNNGTLKVIDFGGSLGSSYYQNLKFLKSLKSVKWCIVEQENFVKTGKKMFENEELRFFSTVAECLKQEEQVDILLFSSVLQYIMDPYLLIDSVLKHKFPYILIDRTGFNAVPKDIITIQKVPERIYKASYPCWFFDKDKLFSVFKGYRLIEEFNSLDQANIPSVYKGALFELE